ncbi:chemotaxis protein CheA [Thiocystis violascens]|uniref:Chemotaxis protein CheA n=1 Tax=Thiocystis violascens (strain ATCC 17096 / DSM 198 / 6111) TaxID=765911 RepID=I3Y5W8_THIV6|nr:chemotaxis protein CheA [Thiocystis violascens]AFL72386.1 chemotaxis protein histidine kinase-like protein [Thiocystis violascens DSM 198]
MNPDQTRLFFLQPFIEEVTELLRSMEDALLALEDNPQGPEALDAVFRTMHTIKSTVDVFGYRSVVDFAHAVETLMEQVRAGRLALTPALIATLFECRDHTARLIDFIVADSEGDTPLDADLRRASDALLARIGQPRRAVFGVSGGLTIAPDVTTTLIDTPTVADGQGQIRFPESRSAYTRYLDLLSLPPDEQVSCIGDLLVGIGALTPAELARALKTQEDASRIATTLDGPPVTRRLGEILIEQGSATPEVIGQAAKTQDAARSRRPEETRQIRVDAQRLGHLIDLVGELVTSSAAIRVMVQRAGIEDMTEVVDGVDYLVSEIRDNALQLRMVPIGDSLSRFRRVVRDASQRLGKAIELVITGGETELDKTVVEKITDPLTHLIRNALDHGIESPEVRRAQGKPATGTVHLNAYHDSGHIVIEIQDDGAGLDTARIRAKAEARGLVKPEDSLSHEDTLRLIFAPGLSTKEEATNLSGRGVGMDVVRRNIEALRGTVDLDSQLGQGTKVTIVLPLTLAIIEGFLVGAGRDQYVIPLAQVAECVELSALDTLKRHGEHYINLRGEVLPFIRLTDLFRNAGERAAGQRESLVVVRFGHHKVGLVVDTLLGELQAVIKPLGKLFERLRGVAGATILGTGDIALILDVAELAAIGQGGRAPIHRKSDLAGRTDATHVET